MLPVGTPMLVALSCLILGAQALIFTPADHGDAMWDTWIYKHPKGGWLMNYLVKHHSGRWNAVGSALSTDGAHYADLGVSVRKDCANASDCAVWLGSGSVWKMLKPGVNASDPSEDDEWIMNYSQQYDCGGGNCQSIFFSTSKDLINWTPVAPDAQAKGGLVFKYNTSEYKQGGRWDCIAVLPRPGGGYYGYWTATPNQDGGAGFGQSDDGLHWTTLPTPGPKIYAEVGGLTQVGGKTFMTFDAGRLFEASSPQGPFGAAPANYNFLTSEGRSMFPRLWGELYTGDPTLSLVTHQQTTPKSVYLGLVKRAVLGTDGVLRAQWWEQNNALKGAPLTVSTMNGTISTTECTSQAPEGDCTLSGLWIEGSMAPSTQGTSGLWLELSGGDGFGMVVDVNGNFNLGAMKENLSWDKAPLVVDRNLTFSAGSTFRAVARSTWDSAGIVEFYLNDVLSLPFTVGSFTGRFQTIGTARITNVNRLTLPSAS